MGRSNLWLDAHVPVESIEYQNSKTGLFGDRSIASAVSGALSQSSI